MVNRIDFEEVKPASELTEEELAKQLDLMGPLESWIKEVKAEAEHRACVLGKKLPGYKVVSSTSRRKWVSEDAVIAKLKSFRLRNDEIYTTKLITPAAAEKLCKSNPQRLVALEALSIKPEGKPKLVPDEMPGKPVAPITDDFAELDKKEDFNFDHLF